jgi:hypothetical protein
MFGEPGPGFTTGWEWLDSSLLIERFLCRIKGERCTTTFLLLKMIIRLSDIGHAK